MAETMTRRTFLKGAAAAAVAVSLAGVLAGCGNHGLAQDEVQVGAFTVKVYNADAHWDNSTSGGSNLYVTATARLTLNSNGSSFTSTSYKGMFVGTVGNNKLMTVSPEANKNLVASDMIILSTFLKKTEVNLRMNFATQEAFEQFKAGTPLKLTVNILNNVPGELYLYWTGENSSLVVTNATPQ